MADRLDESTFISKEGWPLTTIDNSDWLRHGSLYFEFENARCAVGGATLALLHKVMGYSSIRDLAKAAFDMVMKMPVTSPASYRSQPFAELTGESGKLIAVYSMVSPVADLQYVTAASTGGPAVGSGFAKVNRRTDKSLAEIIDMFYTGLPHQGESKVQGIISRAKSQVADYFSSRGFKADEKLNVPLYFCYTGDHWSLSPTTVTLTEGSAIASSGGRASVFVTSDGTSKVTRTVLSVPNGANFVEGGKIVNVLFDESEFLSRCRQARRSVDMNLLIRQVGGSANMVALAVKSIAGVPLHLMLGALAGKHLSLDGVYNPPTKWIDLSDKFFLDNCSINAVRVLDGDVMVQGVDETAGDFLARQKASEAIIAKRETNVVSPLSLNNDFSFPLVMEVCDRALIGGDLFLGKAYMYSGQNFIDDIQTDSSKTARGMEHSFVKSY